MSELNPLTHPDAIEKLQALGREERKLRERSQLISGALLLGFGLGLLSRRQARRSQFAGQNVLITGGTRGLGLQLVREFSSRGATVFFCARHADEVDRAEELLDREGFANVFGLVADVAHPDGPASAVARITSMAGPIDILVNNAGTIQVLPFVDSEEKAFHECLDVFLHAPLRMSREVLPQMMAEGVGTIVNITSLGGQIPAPHLVPYNCGKAAMVALSEGMSVELDRYGVNVLTVKPGLMRTGSHRNAMFGGHAAQEYDWFSRAAVAPGLAISASSAAQSICDAVASRRRTLALGWEAKLGPVFHTLMPELSHSLTSFIEKRLPSGGAEPQPMAMGDLVAPEATPLNAMLERLEKQAMDKHQAARYAVPESPPRPLTV